MRLITLSLLLCPLALLGACGEEQTPPTPTTGSGGAGQTTPDVPAPEVSPELQTEMNDYVSNLNKSNEILADIDSAADAALKSPQLAPIVDELKQFKQRWDGLDEPTRQQLTTAFRDQLGPIVEKLNAQIERVNENPTYGETLEQLVGEIPLINL